jgi:hypothetical protein
VLAGVYGVLNLVQFRLQEPRQGAAQQRRSPVAGVATERWRA